MHFLACRCWFRPQRIRDVHLVKDSIDAALVLQDFVGTFPLSMSVIADHLNNLFLNLNNDFLISFSVGTLHIEFGASHLMT
jgi:predicted ATP-grasp superfamily ATP-dependent carboligase